MFSFLKTILGALFGGSKINIENKKSYALAKNNSTTISGNNNNVTRINNHGLSYDDTKLIFDDLMGKNLRRYVNICEQTVNKRVMEFKEDFFAVLRHSPNYINAFADPAVQDAIFHATEGYVKSGDKGLRELLIKLLKKRTQAGKRDLEEIAQEEAIKVLPLLIPRMLDYLTIIAFFQCIEMPGYGDSFLCDGFEEIAQIICSQEPQRLDFDHLAYAGCGSYFHVFKHWLDLEKIITKKYENRFTKGFSPKEYNLIFLNLNLSDMQKRELFFLDKKAQKLYLQTSSLKELKDICHSLKLPKATEKRLLKAFCENKMTHSEIKTIIQQRPAIAKMIRYWNKYYSHFSITSVGLQIGILRLEQAWGKKSKGKLFPEG